MFVCNKQEEFVLKYIFMHIHSYNVILFDRCIVYSCCCYQSYKIRCMCVGKNGSFGFGFFYIIR